MKGLLTVRTLFALAGSLALAVLLVLILYITELGLSVWERLGQTSAAFWLLYLCFLALMAGGGAYAIWRLASIGRPRVAPVEAQPLSEAGLLERLERTEAAGIPVAEARRELAELNRRRAAGKIIIALFGEVSTGKSSLIGALLPYCEVEVSPRGGTTREVRYHTWASAAGDRLVLADLPGLDEADGGLDPVARDEALRAHVVVYVCDGDATRAHYQGIKSLQQLGRPLLVVLNKTDRYEDWELAMIRNRLRERLGEDIEVVIATSGGVEEIARIYPDGREEVLTRARPPQVEEVRAALQRYIDKDPQALDELRDAAVFVLAQRKLDAAVTGYRRERAETIVQGYSRKAVFGALAAVGPGTDVLIQGYLGISLLRELCALYEVPAREVDLQRFLDLAGSQVRRDFNLLLALAGNVFKAFPGLGTVVGGMLHAVVYGLIFESLGKAVTQSLESRGDLVTGPALRMFEDGLSENLEARAKRFAQQLVLAQQPKPDD